MLIMERENTWMIGDIDVNNIRIWSFGELIKYLFVLFCVKRRIVIEFCLWTNSKANEYGYFVSYEDTAKKLFDKYFFDTQVLDVTLDSEHEANEEILKYQDFYDALVGLPFEHFMELCPRIFDRLCELYYSRNRVNEFWQPVGLSKFVCSLLKEEKCESIYNPFSGLCSYSVFMDEDVYYRGQEKDFESFQIAQLRLDAYDKANSAVYNEDVVSELEGHFDAVVATPPFGGYFVNESDGKKRGTYYDLFLSRSLGSDASLYIGIVPIGFLFSDSHKSLRKELCAHRMVDAIISLPSGVFHPYTEAQSAIVILRPKSKCDRIVFLDAEDCFDIENHELDYEKLLRAFKEAKHNPNQSAPIEDVEVMDYDLTPVGYQMLQVDEKTFVYSVVKIGEVVCREEGNTDIYANGNYVVRQNVLDDNDFSDNLLRLYSYKDVNREIETTVDYQKISGSHLVVTKRKNELLCYYHKGDTSFYVAPYHLVLRIDETRINPYILAYFLLYHPVVKSYVLRLFNGDVKDVAAFRSQEILEKLNSSVRLRFAGKDLNKFFNLKLGLGDMRSQDFFVNSFLSQQKQLREKEIQAERERWGIRETTSDIVHMLGRPFAKQQNIIGFLKSHQPTDAGYEDAVVALADVSNFIRRLVTSVGGDFSKYDYQKEDVDLSTFVKEYVRSWNNFAVKDFGLEVEGRIGDNTLVSVDKDTMMILLDAALDNAWRHGFKKRKNDGNMVCISMSVVDWDGKLYVDMQIGNNGVAIESGLSNEVFVSKGRFSKGTGRTGLGGNHIYQIVKKHDGFLSVSGGGRWSFCLDILLPVKSHDEYISFEPVSHKLFFV